ncbi:MAG: radical SAM protein [Thermodesulfobacteriota bacterium]
MKRRVVLVYPRHTHGWEAQPWVDMPLGLLCVATPLHRAGYPVTILDQRVEPRWRERLAEELARGPLCVGVSTTTGPQLRYALEVSRLVKEAGDTPVVWGGVHASLLPEQVLQEPCVDFVVQGEGEATFRELVEALARGGAASAVPGLWYRGEAGPVSAGLREFVDLDQEPPLAYHLLPLEKYRRTVFGVERLSLFTSRGCPHGCTFCFNQHFDRRRWRALSAEAAVERILDTASRCGVRGLVLYDSNFFADLDRGRRILEGLVRAGRGVALTRLHTRADTLLRMGDADFDLLTRAGCKCLSIGIESGSERLRELLGKKIDLPAVLEKNRELARFPLTPLYFFMMGFPTETPEDLGRTLSAAEALRSGNPNVDLSFNIYTPFPGTELFRTAVEHGLQVPTRTEEWAGFNYRNLAQGAPWLTPEMRRLVEVLDFACMFLGKKYTRPYKETKSPAVLLGKLYAPLARWRAKHLCAAFPWEVRLARLFRLYAKQE